MMGAHIGLLGSRRRMRAMKDAPPWFLLTYLAIMASGLLFMIYMVICQFVGMHYDSAYLRYMDRMGEVRSTCEIDRSANAAISANDLRYSLDLRAQIANWNVDLLAQQPPCGK